MGKIFLNQLEISTIIGTLPHERTVQQKIIVDVEITTPMKAAAISDNLYDALDYSAVENEVVQLAEKSSFQLLEALLNAIGTAVIRHPEVISCKVRIEKPAASKYGRSVSVEGEFDSEGLVE
ncbi:MAG: dihydroneopterin aldolase [Lentisphaerae bacterium]|nr:dihydroneopterin aldolase [Lentisphaerota bacterium]